jgi:uncharacterized protein involved in type VI secretion and phage assembly
MLKKTRVTTSMDTARVANALRTPGIDPRVWAAVATVKAIHVDAEGVWLKVVYTISGLQETARWASPYAGPGYGLYLPLEIDDEVLVIAPEGDPDMGLLAMPKAWDRGTPPPAELASRPTDGLLIMKEGATLRIVVQGAGDVVIDPRGSGKVYLGGEGGTSPVARVGDTIEITQDQLTAATAQAGGNAVSVAAPLQGTITTGASKTEAK